MTATYGTAARIIEYGMLDAGLLQDGQKPNSDQVAKNMNRLNDIITFWQSKGIKLWTWLDQSVTLVAGQATYTFMPGGSISMTKPARVISAYYLDSSGNKVPLTSLSWDEYSRLSR